MPSCLHCGQGFEEGKSCETCKRIERFKKQVSKEKQAQKAAIKNKLPLASSSSSNLPPIIPSSNPFSSLPPELIHHILSFLDLHSLCRFAKTSSRHRHLALDISLFRKVSISSSIGVDRALTQTVSRYAHELRSFSLSPSITVSPASLGFLAACHHLKSIRMTSASGLPPPLFSRMGELEECHLPDCKDLSGPSLVSLSLSSPSLRSLSLGGFPLDSPSFLRACQHLGNLSFLSLDASDLSGAHLAEGLSKLGNLRVLSLKENRGLEHLPAGFWRCLPKITSLNLNRCDRLSEGALLLLAEELPPSLTELNLGYVAGVTNAVISALGEHLTSLRELVLTSCSNFDSLSSGRGGLGSFHSFSFFPSLRCVSLNSCKGVSPAFLGILSACPLEEIDLSYVRVDDLGLDALVHFRAGRSLKVLKLVQADITDLGLASLSLKAPELTELVLSYCKITTIGIIALTKGCPKIEKLNLRNCKGVTEGSLEPMADAFRRLKELVFVGTEIKNSSILAIKRAGQSRAPFFT